MIAFEIRLISTLYNNIRGRFSVCLYMSLSKFVSSILIKFVSIEISKKYFIICIVMYIYIPYANFLIIRIA